MVSCRYRQRTRPGDDASFLRNLQFKGLLPPRTCTLSLHDALPISSEAGSTEKVVKYINEARGMSISILPPDVNESDLYFTPVGEAIRFGLAAIKNVDRKSVV